MIKKLLIIIFLSGIFLSGFVFSIQAQQKKLDKIAYEYAQKSFQNFREMLSIFSDAHYPNKTYENVTWCKQQFEARGFTTQELKTKPRGFTTQELNTKRLPLLLATRKAKGAKKTILIYLQIDGQPVDTSAWFQENPWKPVLKQRNAKYNPSEDDLSKEWEEILWENLSKKYNPEYRIFARATSDAKGPAAMFLAALDAAAKLKVKPNYNIKVIMDFEEELGSPNLPQAVKDYQKELAADALIIYDGPRHISNQPTLVYGARGIATVELEVFGPRKALHSGHYGNYAPNPALTLSQLLVSMKDRNGRVVIPGWYDGITLSLEVKKILKQVPDDEQDIRKKIGISKIDKVATNYQEAIQYPSLNILGIESGWVRKETRTIVPATAIAELDIRLVKESDPDKLIKLLKKHIEAQGFYFVNEQPTEAERRQYDKLIRFESKVFYQAFRTDFNTKVGKWLRRAMKTAFGKKPIQIRMAGGSIPISPFVTTLNIPAVLVPTVNYDNNQHSPNENIRVGNYVEGVKTFLAILMEKY